jgi:prophage regulatory protein
MVGMSKPTMRHEIQKPTDDRLISSLDLAHHLGISPPTLWRWRKRPDFPRAIRLSHRTVVFRQREIDAWLERSAEAQP